MSQRGDDESVTWQPTPLLIISVAEQGQCVAGAVDHVDDDEFGVGEGVIDRVALVEVDAQARGQFFAGGSKFGVVQKRFEALGDRAHKARRGGG